MYTEIGSSIKIFNCTEELFHLISKELTIPNPTYLSLIKRGIIKKNQYTYVPKTISVFYCQDTMVEIPFGCLYMIWPYINKSPYTINLNKTEDISIKNQKGKFTLIDYQKEAVKEMLNARGGVLISKCGSGKTVMGVEIIRRIGKRFLWLTHTKSLLEQTYNRMLEMYPTLKLGRVTEGKVDFGQDGTVATIQTLSKIDPKEYRDMFEVVIVDEAAHCVGSPETSRAFSTIVNNVAARYKYGLTATPSRSDGMIPTMYMYLGTSKQGSLTPTYEVKGTRSLSARHIRYDLDTVVDKNISLMKGDKIDYNALINMLSEDKVRNKEIVRNIVSLNEANRIQIVLCHRVNHCKEITRLLKEANIKVEMLTAKTTKKVRETVLNRKTEWTVLVATYSLLKEGIDIAALDTLHLVTPQGNEATTVQCAGRIERYLENKPDPLIYDYVDTTIGYCVGTYNRRSKYIYNH